MNYLDETNAPEYITIDLMKYLSRHPWDAEPVTNNATDEEVDAFIRIFMVHANRISPNASSYGLKHTCERAIGYFFHGSSNYHYVSNDQFKAAMQRANYTTRPQGNDSPNEYYAFCWRKGALKLFDAMRHIR